MMIGVNIDVYGVYEYASSPEDEAPSKRRRTSGDDGPANDQKDDLIAVTIK